MAPPASTSAQPADQPDSPIGGGGGGTIKSNRPKSQMGFGISLGDLSRDKLKKTGKGPLPEQPKKPELPTLPPPSDMPTVCVVIVVLFFIY